MKLRDKLKNINKKELTIFLIILLIGIFARVYEFPNALKEVNVDEMMLAVNAKSIADTGKDINGISYPVYLLGWAGQSVALLYITVFCIQIFGYSLFAVRLPMLVISIISLIVFYDFVRRISKNNTIALICLGLLAISPWHILQSMWALDCNILPHILLFAVYLLYIAITKQKKWMLYLSMVFFAFTLYSYGVAVYFTPILLLVLAIYLKHKKKISTLDLIICIIIFLIIVIPIILTFAINFLKINQSIYWGSITIPYYENLSRTEDMLFFSSNILEQLIKNIYCILIVIFGQVDGLDWNSSEIFGTLYHFTVVFAFIPLIVWKIDSKRKKELKARGEINNKEDEDLNLSKVLLISWLCISIFTGIVINYANINRLNTIWYPTIILAGEGIYWFYERIKYGERKY